MDGPEVWEFEKKKREDAAGFLGSTPQRETERGKEGPQKRSSFSLVLTSVTKKKGEERWGRKKEEKREETLCPFLT